MPPTVLVIEDDPAIRRGLVDALEFGGFEVRQAGRGDEALEIAFLPETDLVLLDVLLPGKNGFDVLCEIRRRRPHLPVIMVTARGAEGDRVRGLRQGADDYVVKPFSAKELLARVEAVLRRSPDRPSDCSHLELRGRRIDFDRQTVRLPSGETRSLTDREVAILRHLAAARGKAMSRDELLRQVWGLDPEGLRTRTVDMHIARLREKLLDDPDKPSLIETVRSRGYRLAEPENHPPDLLREPSP